MLTVSITLVIGAIITCVGKVLIEHAHPPRGRFVDVGGLRQHVVDSGATGEARDAAVDFVQASMTSGRTIHGYEVDDVARGIINRRGYGQYFVHRTGHSIGEDVHGNGANIDNFETRDTRKIIPRICFSIEPGIYLPEFGVRSEVNVFVEESGARVTGEIQRAIVPILAPAY